jgi:hypothetical protein
MTVVNITVENDADFYRLFQYQTIGGVPIDITGAQMLMMLRRRAADEAAQMKLSTETGEITIVDPINGLFSIMIKQNALERLGLGDYAHSNILIRGASKKSIWTGTLTNNPGPSR